MRWTDIITLITATRRLSENGIPVSSGETYRNVRAVKKSTGHKDFLDAYKAGLKAELLFDVRSVEYNGEKLLEHEGKRYRIYKTYLKGTDGITELKVTDLG